MRQGPPRVFSRPARLAEGSEKEVKQNNFQNDSGESETQLKWPVDVALGGGKYVVADTYNHRILVWDELPTENGVPPDLILNSAPGEHSIDPNPRHDQFAWPWGVWTNGEMLIVSSTSSDVNLGGVRPGGWVLIWNSFPTQSGQPADVLLSAGGDIGTPRSITTDGESFLIVGDHNAQHQC